MDLCISHFARALVFPLWCIGLIDKSTSNTFKKLISFHEPLSENSYFWTILKSTLKDSFKSWCFPLLSCSQITFMLSGLLEEINFRVSWANLLSFEACCNFCRTSSRLFPANNLEILHQTYLLISSSWSKFPSTCSHNSLNIASMLLLLKLFTFGLSNSLFSSSGTRSLGR